MKYSCLLFSEGGKDKNFLNALVELEKFRYHTKKWVILTRNASGSCPRVILEQCKKVILSIKRDLVLCFIDLDKLKHDYPKDWGKEKTILDTEALKFGIVIIWQIDNAEEEEYKKVIGESNNKKHKLNKEAIERIEEFINSEFWNKIITKIKDKEQKLDKA